MKKAVYVVLFLLSLTFVFRSELGAAEQSDNPFFNDWNTLFGVAPFDQIKDEHFRPAIEEGIKRSKAEISAIVANTEAPTFANTIEALEYSGAFLSRTLGVFNNYTTIKTNDLMKQLDKEMSALVTQHNDDVYLNKGLFERVKAVYQQYQGTTSSSLTEEQQTLLRETYMQFIRSGMNLSVADQEKVRAINKELSDLAVEFKNHLTADIGALRLEIQNVSELKGLNPDVIESAAQAATEAQCSCKYLFYPDMGSMEAILTNAENRPLREKMLSLYAKRANQGNENDNKGLVVRMARLRLEKAKLLGFEDHAGYVLDDQMAKNPANVYQLLGKVWEPGLNRAKEEAGELQAMIDAEGKGFKLAAWDWRYYAEKLRKAKYDLNEEELRPYFELEATLKGLFDVVGKLYGITLVERKDIPLYHPEARAFEVRNTLNGSHVGVLFMDFFPRPNTKDPHAWMSEFRGQKRDQAGKFVTPVLINVFNFQRPPQGSPAFLTFSDAQTLYHEFGHAVHGLLSNCTYPSLSGTSTKRDFVELPSQIMQNWATSPEVLRLYAKHYQTGEAIPDSLIEKIHNARFFNQGFETTEYLAASYLDMAWHDIADEGNLPVDVNAFESGALSKIGLISEVLPRYRTSYFMHIFNYGYDAGYYGYIWAEVLDADAFEVFQKAGIFNAEVANSFRKNILEKGGTADPMELYKRFRGSEPTVEPLLRRRGFIQ